MRLNPYHPNWYWNIEGLCLQIAASTRRPSTLSSVSTTRSSGSRPISPPATPMCGRDERATHHCLRLFAARPDFNMSWFRRGLPVSSAPHLHRLLDGFRRAGIKDGPGINLPSILVRMTRFAACQRPLRKTAGRGDFVRRNLTDSDGPTATLVGAQPRAGRARLATGFRGSFICSVVCVTADAMPSSTMPSVAAATPRAATATGLISICGSPRRPPTEMPV